MRLKWPRPIVAVWGAPDRPGLQDHVASADTH